MKRDYQVSPSMIGGEASVIWFYNNTKLVKPFNDTNPLSVSANQCHNLTICLWYVSPLIEFSNSPKAQFALLGELNKWTAVSRQRFTSIDADTTAGQGTITIQGVPGETIPVVIYHSIFFSVTVNCQISSNQNSTKIIITTSDVLCS